MKNFIQPGKTLSLVAPYAVDSGDLVVSGAIVGVASGDADNGASVDVAVSGVFELPKVPAVTFTQGEIVYTTPTGGPVTDNTDADSNSGGTVKVGYAVQAAGVGVSTVKVRLVSVV